MIQHIIGFSVKNKLIIGLFILALIGGGMVALSDLPIDAVPDITNNQVQVVTVSGSLAPEEVEQFITYPVEVAMANIPHVVEIRSISRFGLSVVTIVFDDKVPILDARQFVQEQINLALEEIPEGLGTPELMPITTGLGEIYQYVLKPKKGFEHLYDPMKLRTIQDWIVKRQLAGTPGIIEISSFGGYLKQYEVSLDPLLCKLHGVSLTEVFDALHRNNQNSGGSYIEKNTNAYYIRTEGLIKSESDIEHIVVKVRNGVPVLVKDLGKVRMGSPKRFGAMTMDGAGEAVGGIALMLKGANSSEALRNVHERIDRIRLSLPEGVEIYPYLDRSDLVAKTIETVRTNLLEGGIIVILVLILLLGNFRAGLIVASVIPLSMLFALILMRIFGVSANLMSLGAIDFGIVVDGAVIIVEGVLHTLFTVYVGKHLTQEELDHAVIDSSAKLFRSAVFGVFIILVVFIPIMTLTGIEGKMFRPMAMTFTFAVLGALILSLTYVPMMSSLVLPKRISAKLSLADRLVRFMRWLYRPTIQGALRFPYVVLGAALALLLGAFLLFRTLGAEFIPTLEEGDLAMQMTIQPGSSLQQSVKTASRAEQVLLDEFPEVKHVVSKIGTAEVPTDPMAIEDADIMIILEEKENWTSAESREALVEKMKTALEKVPGASFEFTQPIQLRFNELMTGAKTDIAVKIFGEDNQKLKDLADAAALLIEQVEGAADVKVDQTEGLPQLRVAFNRQKIAQYGVNIEELNTLVRTAYAGEAAGVIFENERKFDLVVRFNEQARQDLDLDRIFVNLPSGGNIPLSQLASVEYTEGPMQISRENTRRRINIGINVRNRDVASLVAEIESTLKQGLQLPPGYSLAYGGQFENLEKARRRLSVAVPVALASIFLLLFFTFGRVKYALTIFSAIPLSAIGGVVALWARDMPFSISAGVGFIALFGVAVLNGIVLISHFNRMRFEEDKHDLKKIIVEGGCVRLRPVVMTATVAAMGFLPMALSTSNGAEVQKPLATVVIGGLITATLLTLIVLPVLYYLVNRKRSEFKVNGAPLAGLLLLMLGVGLQAQTPLTAEDAVAKALDNHPLLEQARLEVRSFEIARAGNAWMPPLEVQVGGGQFNTTLADYQFSITQGLGNWGANRERKELALQQQQGATWELALLERRLGYEVQKQWQQWAYSTIRTRWFADQMARLQEMQAKAQLQQATGESGALQLNLIEGEYLAYRQNWQAEAQRTRQALTDLLNLMQTQGDFSMPLDSLTPLPLEQNDSALQGELLGPARQAIEIARQQKDLEATSLHPELSVGYFAQSIQPDWFLQGVQVGLSLPLWKKYQHAQIDRKEVAILQREQALLLQSTQLENQRLLAFRQAAALEEELRTFGDQLPGKAWKLMTLARIQLELGEIDYFQYFQYLGKAMEYRLSYIELVHAYNQAVLDYNYLTD